MFLQAKPVWIKNKENEMNVFGAFRAAAGSLKRTELHIAACTFYQVHVNGKFVAAGPARAAKGYARMDVLSLDGFDADQNEIVITVAGYGCRSLSTVKSPAFVQAELHRDGEALLWTGKHFEGYLSSRRVQKVQRYSLQRHFSEVWDLRKPLFDQSAELVIQPDLKILERVAPYPLYRDAAVTEAVSVGRLQQDDSLPVHTHKYSGTVSPFWGCFDDAEIPHVPFVWLQQQGQTKTGGRTPLPLTLHADEYAILDFGCIEAGMLMLDACAQEESEVIAAFSEISTADHFSFTAMNAHNAVEWIMAKGQLHSMSFEAYTARYVLLAVKRGCVRLDGFGIKTYEADTSAVQLPSTGNPVLDAVSRGAVRTYAHNAVDLYTDCPSRERAGWLCDSYFTARTEHFLFGKVPVEKAFLENYRLFSGDEGLPQGVLPMCYPSDLQENGNFIPQWTMWYILEVCEHLKIRAPEEDPELFRPSVEKLLAFYCLYENEDGLLEKLPKWNFLEWSAANQWTMDVNYPTNFLYAQVLEAAADLYGDDHLRQRSMEVRRETIRQSFDGTMFLDHAVRDVQGKLVRQTDCSEIGQYYAILFGDIDLNDSAYAQLKRLVTQVFGAQRRQPMENVEEINAFIGVYLRLEALLKMGEYELVLRDVRDFFGTMEQETGTLWESRERERGSKDHGFASYALVALSKALKSKAKA